jgi:tRNA(Ile)-lysidine synthetase-like protein
MRFVEKMGEDLDVPVCVKRVPRKKGCPHCGPAFEERARNLRYAFLRELRSRYGAGKILLAHTADDQVETVLMRILEGAGISGLKGIPRKTDDGIERPLLDTWREEIIEYLRKHKIPYRVDRSNFDTRFERNWVRHALIPLLEKRYGKSIKKRIFELGERFREIDEFIEAAARRWMRRNARIEGMAGEARGSAQTAVRARLPRKPFAKLPGAVRKKVLQRICFERLGIAPNGRLLESMDRLVVSGGPSSRLNLGKGATLRSRYDQAIFEMTDDIPQKMRSSKRQVIVRMDGPGAAFSWEEKGKLSQGALKRLGKGERAAAFDAGALSMPLAIRPLRKGDRIRPFGLDGEKKVKEILIDRKVPRDERWGRPVVCDAEGRILWIPGVVRSAHGPVSSGTRKSIVLGMRRGPR